jgi:hypothetical protein
MDINEGDKRTLLTRQEKPSKETKKLVISVLGKNDRLIRRYRDNESFGGKGIQLSKMLA